MRGGKITVFLPQLLKNGVHEEICTIILFNGISCNDNNSTIIIPFLLVQT